MDTPVIEITADELAVGSVDERIKESTDTILNRVEELIGLLASRIEMESAGNSETAGSRCDNESISPSGNQHDSGGVDVHRKLLETSPVFNCLQKLIKLFIVGWKICRRYPAVMSTMHVDQGVGQKGFETIFRGFEPHYIFLHFIPETLTKSTYFQK